MRHVIGTHDLVILTERLLNWTDSELREDLKGYPQIDPKRAIEMRDFLLNWVKEAVAKEYA